MALGSIHQLNQWFIDWGSTGYVAPWIAENHLQGVAHIQEHMLTLLQHSLSIHKPIGKSYQS